MPTLEKLGLNAGKMVGLPNGDGGVYNVEIIRVSRVARSDGDAGYILVRAPENLDLEQAAESTGGKPWIYNSVIDSGRHIDSLRPRETTDVNVIVFPLDFDGFQPPSAPSLAGESSPEL